MSSSSSSSTASRKKRTPKLSAQAHSALPITEVSSSSSSTVALPIRAAPPRKDLHLYSNKEMLDTECVLFLPVPSSVFQPKSSKDWQDDALMRYNPNLTEPQAFDPYCSEFVTLSTDVSSCLLSPAEANMMVDQEASAPPSSSSSMGSAVLVSSSSSSSSKEACSSSGQRVMSLNQWPSHTTRWCGNCCGPFDTVPIYLPVRIAEGTVEVRPDVVFCDFPCARTFNEETTSGIRQVTEINTMLQVLKEAMTGCKAPIERAPSRLMRDTFQDSGIGLSVDQMRCAQQACVVYMPPLRPVSVIAETVFGGPARSFSSIKS